MTLTHLATEDVLAPWLQLTTLLSGRLQQNFIHWLQQSDQLIRPDLTSDLLNGSAGVWFALYQCHKACPELVTEQVLADGLTQLVEQSRRLWPDLSSCYGLAGIGWLLEYLCAEQGWAEDHNEELAQAYQRALTRHRWQGDYEYVVGLTGFATFILRRAASEAAAMPLADAWLSQLELLAQHDNQGGCYWVTPAHSAFRIIRHNPLYQEVNLGMAHGITGVLHTLCRAATIVPLRERALRLARAGANYLLRQQNVPSTGSVFPNLAGKPARSRLGWCYGDLPIAVVLARLGQLTGEAVYQAKAREVVAACVSRSAADGSIADAGLCHGACGVWLMLHQLAALLPGSVPESALDYWQKWLLQHVGRRPVTAEGCGRYFAESYQPCDGVLEGDAGVLLTLLVMQGQPADWLDLLLLA